MLSHVIIAVKASKGEALFLLALKEDAGLGGVLFLKTKYFNLNFT